MTIIENSKKELLDKETLRYSQKVKKNDKDNTQTSKKKQD